MLHSYYQTTELTSISRAWLYKIALIFEMATGIWY